MVTRLGWIALAALVVAAVGCTKTAVLKETTPVVVTAEPPPPPPEPEPEPKRVEVKKERIQVNEKIHFEFDSAKLRERSHELLDEIAGVINEHPELTEIRVEGHTDNQGKRDYNLELSKRRAQAVRDYLVEEGGVEPDRLKIEGYGFDEPIATNETEEGRAQNRRVEFKILERDEEMAAEAGGGEAPEDAEIGATAGEEAAGDGEEAAGDGAKEVAGGEKEAGAEEKAGAPEAAGDGEGDGGAEASAGDAEEASAGGEKAAATSEEEGEK